MTCGVAPATRPPTIALQPAGLAELSTLVALDVASFGSDAAAVTERMRALALMPNRQTLLALIAGEPVGKIHVKRERGDAVLHDLCIAPGHRGRGLGRSMVGTTVWRELARGARRVTLDVAAGNAAALRTYASCGFSIAAEYDYWRLPLAACR
jgi:ribosomal protein S18 acetylase RimI-like enzyme